MSAEQSKEEINNENLAVDYPIPGPSDQPTDCTFCPLGPFQTRMICPYCGETILTKLVESKVERKSRSFQCFRCLCCIPMPRFKKLLVKSTTTTHYCSNCDAKLGIVELKTFHNY